MSRYTHIAVTALDIKRGERGSSSACPIARAIKRVTKTREVEVMSYEIRVGATWYPASDRCAAFISKFDRTGSGKPFTLALPIKQRRLAR